MLEDQKARFRVVEESRESKNAGVPETALNLDLSIVLSSVSCQDLYTMRQFLLPLGAIAAPR
jgi:hypothetical protein